MNQRIKLIPKTLKGKNLLQNRGQTGYILEECESVLCLNDKPGICIRFDNRPKYLKIIEDFCTANNCNDEYKARLYETEYDMWIEKDSKDFEIIYE